MNKKVKVEFSYEGKDYKFCAYVGTFSTGVTYLLNIEENENVSLADWDDFHSINFYCDGHIFEVEFEFGENLEYSFDKPIKGIVWNEDGDMPEVDALSGYDIEVTVTNTYKKSKTR